MAQSLRKIVTRKIWRFPVWVYLLGALVIAGAISGGNDDAETASDLPNEDVAVETTRSAAAPEQEPTLAAFAGGDWQSRIDEIVAGDLSPIGKGDAVDALAKEYSMTEADVTEQTLYLADQVRTRAIIMRVADKQFMYRLIFIARTLDKAIDESHPADDFAYDSWQVARDLARGTETPDSDFISANLDQLDRAIAENGW